MINEFKENFPLLSEKVANGPILYSRTNVPIFSIEDIQKNCIDKHRLKIAILQLQEKDSVILQDFAQVILEKLTTPEERKGIMLEFRKDKVTQIKVDELLKELGI